MAEDYELCTFQKHHKQKILLFLSAMRSYADNLKKNKYKVEYKKIEDKDFKNSYFDKLLTIVNNKKITEVSSFEVEDKFFEEKLKRFIKRKKMTRENVAEFLYGKKDKVGDIIDKVLNLSKSMKKLLS